MYVYIKSESCCYTVGFYDPAGKWNPESDFSNQEEAANRVHYLNGGEHEKPWRYHINSDFSHEAYHKVKP